MNRGFTRENLFYFEQEFYTGVYMSKLVLKKESAVELFALNPDMSRDEVAQRLGVSVFTVDNWRRNPNFIEAIYDRYMVEFGGELPAVLTAMIREAKAGNVQAGRLVLEHSGKLVKNVNITVDSPFEKWLKKVDDAEVVDGEFTEEMMEVAIECPIDVELPIRNEENQQHRAKQEAKVLKKTIKEEKKHQEYLKKRREWHNWTVRAKKVGVAPLPSKRPTKGQRKVWEDEIIGREDLQKGDTGR